MAASYEWTNVEAACSRAAEASLGFSNKKMKPWISDSTSQCIKHRRAIKRNAAKKSELFFFYKLADLEVKGQASNDKDAFCSNIVSEAEAAGYRNRSLYES